MLLANRNERADMLLANQNRREDMLLGNQNERADLIRAEDRANALTDIAGERDWQRDFLDYKAENSTPESLKISPNWIKQQTKAFEELSNIDERRARISALVNNVPEGAFSGFFGQTSQSLKDLFWFSR